MQWIPRQTPLYIGKSEGCRPIDYYYWLLSCDLLDRKRHMWKMRPNFSHLYSPKISHIKYPTEYIKREEFNRILHKCEQLDLIRHSYDIFDRVHHMWKIRPNFSHLYSPIMSRVKYSTIMLNVRTSMIYYTAVEKSTSFVQVVTYWAENVTCEKIRPNFSHLYSPQMWPNIAHVSNSIEFFTAVKNFHRIRHSHDIFDRIHHMWKFRPNFSHIYSPKISHVKYPTEYIKRDEFDRIRHRCEQLDLIRHSYDIFDRIHHVKNPTEFLTHIFADNATCNLFDRLYQTWEIKWYSANMWQKSIEFVQDVTYWTEYMTCEKSDRISHTYICRKYQM